MTGSPAGPIDAPIGSVAAEASVATGAGSAVEVPAAADDEDEGDAEEVVEVEEVGEADSVDPEEVGGGVLDTVDAELVASARSID
jgi:hypothetical protein